MKKNGIDKSEPCIVPFTRHVSYASHKTGTKIELYDRTLKILLVQGYSVVFWSNFMLHKR